MMNYMKSELYRVTHTSGIYCFAGILVLVSVLLNVGIYTLGGNRYNTTSFSYSNLVANPMAFVITGTVIAYFLYEGNPRNGNLKNTVAGGIPRIKIFAGECVVSTITATVMMFLTLGAWIISANLLLKKSGPVQLKDLLTEVPAVYLIAVAGIISGILLLELCEKNITGILVWCTIWLFIPVILNYLGMRFEVIHNIAMWLPGNFFKLVNGIHVNSSECITIWDTQEGWMRCLLSGSGGIFIFSLFGMVSLKRKDL